MPARRLMPAITPGSQRGPAFLCCDLQNTFATVIPNFKKSVFVANRFLSVARLFPDSTKFVTTEQYPKAFGPTVPQIPLQATREAGAPNIAPSVSKTKFSMCVPEVKNHLVTNPDVVLFGIEAHVCVLQTVEDLVADGKNVYVAVDGTFSQRMEDRKYALKQMEGLDAGSGDRGRVVLSTSEAILFQMMRDSKHPNFKAVSALCREKPPAIVS